MSRFIIKKTTVNKSKFNKKNLSYYKQENNTLKENDTMNNDKITQIQNVLSNSNKDEKAIKKIKKDKGLMEKTTTNKVILTEDNKELLVD